MNQLKIKLSSVLLGAALVLTGWAMNLMQSSQPLPINVQVPNVELGGAGAEFYEVASSSAITADTSSTFLTATNTARSYLAIVNDGANPVYLNFGDEPAVANSGVRLNASGGSIEFTTENLYKGAIRVIADGGTSVLTFLEANGR